MNIALIPNHDLARRLADASQGLAKRHPAIVQLAYTKARLAMAPHLTLYQVPLFLTDIEEVAQRLGTLAAGQLPFMLHATKYVYNGGEASFEVVQKPLTGFQHAVIEALNPLRSGLLLERDPAGNDL